MSNRGPLTLSFSIAHMMTIFCEEHRPLPGAGGYPHAWGPLRKSGSPSTPLLVLAFTDATSLSPFIECSLI